MRQVHSIRVHRRQRPRDGIVNSSVARLYRTILALLRVVIDEFRARVKTPCPDIRRCGPMRVPRPGQRLPGSKSLPRAR